MAVSLYQCFVAIYLDVSVTVTVAMLMATLLPVFGDSV
jgi:hypothetical protein